MPPPNKTAMPSLTAAKLMRYALDGTWMKDESEWPLGIRRVADAR